MSWIYDLWKREHGTFIFTKKILKLQKIEILGGEVVHKAAKKIDWILFPLLHCIFALCNHGITTQM